MRIVTGIIATLVLWSCHEVIRPEKPENLIAKDTMIQILAEAYLGNSARSITNKTLREKGVQIDSIIYTRFGVDSLQFAESNTYYASQVNEYIKLIKGVEEELKARKAVIDSLYEIEKEAKQKKKDSINKKQLIKNPGLKQDTVKAQLLEPVEEQ